MTKRDLVDAYVRGDVDRRSFIRKLSAMGVSATAAVAYAGSLGGDAAAAPARNGAGFVARLQDADEDYGIAVIIQNILEALQTLLARIQSIIDRLTSIISQPNAPRPDLLGRIQSQMAEQFEALTTQMELGFGVNSAMVDGLAGRSMRLQGGDTIQDVANDMNVQTGLLAAIIPAIESGEARQLMTNIGLVTARHAALINDLAGLDPIPNTFEVPIDPTTVQ